MSVTPGHVEHLRGRIAELEAALEKMRIERDTARIEGKIRAKPTTLEARNRELEAENARLNMEMAAYRQGCTKEDAAAMQAVMRALEDEKIARAALDAKDGSAVDRGGEHESR